VLNLLLQLLDGAFIEFQDESSLAELLARFKLLLAHRHELGFLKFFGGFVSLETLSCLVYAVSWAMLRFRMLLILFLEAARLSLIPYLFNYE
jgi:hypothetical protein